MLLLTSVTDVLRVVTGNAASVAYHASYVDNASGTITPGHITNAAPISTATTTTVVGSPGASTQRNVRALVLNNTHATASTTVEVQHYDGTTAVPLMDCTLLPGESLALDEGGVWHHRDANAAEYAAAAPAVSNLGPTGTLAETMPRETCLEANVTMGASGVLNLQAVYLRAGQTVSNITLASATTAAGTPTHYWFALYSQAGLALLASSADQTTAAWAANTVKTLAMATPYKVPVSGMYYIGYCMVATTVPTLKGQTKTDGALGFAAPALYGPSSTGITTTLPNPCAAISAKGTASFYAAVS